MKKDDLLYFLHIRDAIRKILEYTSNVDEQNFLKNSILQDALVRQIEIIGEASNKISAKSRNKYPNVPWKQMIGMRNRIIHEYFGVRLDIVWDTVRNNIPGLKDDINKIIEELTPQSSLDL
jgi:uncharacterized protein with HEPN domain